MFKFISTYMLLWYYKVGLDKKLDKDKKNVAFLQTLL